MFITLFLIISYTLISLALLNSRKGETLYIYNDEVSLNLVLTNDLYLSYNIENISNSSEDIFEHTKKILASRAFELSDLVSNIVIINNEDASKNQELLKVLKAS